MDTGRPFRHTDLVASGALTRHHLVDGRFTTLFAGVSVDRGVVVTMVDALARVTGLEVAAVRALAARRPGDRDVRRVEPVLAWVEPRSPDEDASRRRVRLLARGVPVPRVEQCLLDARGDVVARLALAWPEARTGIAVAPGARDRARSIGWEVVTPAVGVTSDELVRWVTRSFDRWDPARRLGMPLTLRLPPAAEPDGVCDDGLSRLVPDCR